MQVSHRRYTFWVVRNNSQVIDAINELTKCRKENSITTFGFTILYTKLPHSKLLMVLNNLIDFCFDAGETKYIIVSTYRARWVKYIKNKVPFLPTYSYIFLKVNG